jgi:hypothetical protein
MNQSDVVQIHETIEACIKSFGEPDTHTKLALEVLFELIYISEQKANNGKNLSISGETG